MDRILNKNWKENFEIKSIKIWEIKYKFKTNNKTN